MRSIAGVLRLHHPIWLKAVVAVFGTTISPYLLFRPSEEEVGDRRVHVRRRDLLEVPEQCPDELLHIRIDNQGPLRRTGGQSGSVPPGDGVRA